jgi:hypothetical protein
VKRTEKKKKNLTSTTMSANESEGFYREYRNWNDIEQGTRASWWE